MGEPRSDPPLHTQVPGGRDPPPHIQSTYRCPPPPRDSTCILGYDNTGRPVVLTAPCHLSFYRPPHPSTPQRLVHSCSTHSSTHFTSLSPLQSLSFFIGNMVILRRILTATIHDYIVILHQYNTSIMTGFTRCIKLSEFSM